MQTSGSRPYRVKDLTNRLFGSLTAIHTAGRDKQSRAIWMCECKCGSRKAVPSRHLLSGRVVSCGCVASAVYANNGKRGAHKISGAKSRMYKPSLTQSDRTDRRNLPEVREWRKFIFSRDDYTCQLCGARGVNLHPHHLYSWAEYPDRRLDVSNGLTLCEQHHDEFHKSMGGPRRPCTPEDFGAFKARWYLDREIQRLEGKA